MYKFWDKPPVEELELVLGEQFTVAKAQHYLFFPNEEIMSLYATLILSAPPNHPTHPQTKVQIPFLAMLYLHHSHQWPLMRYFILANGLVSLADLFACPNVYIRSQAIDTFLHLTNAEIYDWWEEKPLVTDVPIRGHLAALSQGPFVRLLLFENFRKDGDLYPMQSMYCLQIFAFWASWIRKFYAQNELRLSGDILEQLRIWPEYRSGEEAELARKLYEDFSRFPIQEEGVANEGMSLKVEQVPTISAATLPEEATLPVLEEATQEDVPILSSKNAKQEQEKKEEEQKEEQKEEIEPVGVGRVAGNGLFVKGRFIEALAAYTAGLNEPEIDAEEMSLLYCNRSAVHLKLAGEGTASEHWTLALKDCDMALKLRPKYAKAHYRRAKSLEGLQRLSDAMAAASMAVRCVTGGSTEMTAYIQELKARIREQKQQAKRKV